MAVKGTITTSDYMDYEEFESFLDKLHTTQQYFWELYARVSFYTALRASDVLKLKWHQILNQPSVTVVAQKTHKAQYAKFSIESQLKIKELYKLLGSPALDSYCFAKPNVKNQNPITIQAVNVKLKGFKAMWKLNIGNFSTHTFRKTFGRYVYESMGKTAESLIILNHIFKHASISTTEIYIGIRADEVNHIFDAINI